MNPIETILALPLALGRLAEAVGIRPAYGIVLILLVFIFLIGLTAERIFVNLHKFNS